ncbi:hypothetical protein C7451_10186 [Blastomonas natatoria]|uniref:Uncharacterized protein n=1 Tax=Blastomonas natatoria TaxID=34015 RepID=A0A2V3VCY0_9SPHN|nr:hypothetical protein [Blastomonas natatoria]PXW79024.1 hypothetical protein C7451_10186 [Blastomonas natatoria]
MSLSSAQTEWFQSAPMHWQHEARRRFEAISFFAEARALGVPLAAKLAAHGYGYSDRSIQRWARSAAVCGPDLAVFLLCPRNESSMRPLDLAPYQIEGGKA